MSQPRKRSLPRAAALGLLLLLLAAWPLRQACVEGSLAGGGPDVISTFWGMWWFQQEWIFGGWTGLVNHPHGAFGAVLSPSSAILWALTEPLVGPALAASLTAVLQLAALAAAVGWLAGLAGADAWGRATAAVSVFVGRYLVFGLGEGSIVAVTALPVPLGMGAILLTLYGKKPRHAAVAGAACMAWAALENPYLAPVLPGLAMLAWLHSLWRQKGDKVVRQRWFRLSGMLVLGSLGVLGVALVFGRSASPDYPREVAGQVVGWLGQNWSVVDLPWARATPGEWLFPAPVQWTTTATDGVSAGGGLTLGLGVWAMAIIGGALNRRASAPYWGLALLGLALSIGSLFGNLVTPFLLLNAVMETVARPLTQPTRFLVLAVIGLGVCAGLGMTAIRQRLDKPKALGPTLLTLLVLESAAVGALSLTPPITPLPQVPCTTHLEATETGNTPPPGLLVWPWDALDEEPSQAQLLQVAHGLPGPHRGIASWLLHDKSVSPSLRNAGFRARPLPAELDRTALVRLGYRWVLVDAAADGPGSRWLSTQFASEPEDCGNYTLYDLAD